MTPQLQQAIRLLQLSTLELQTEIQQALESNPMLEEDPGTDEAEGDNGSEQTADQASAEQTATEDNAADASGDSSLDMQREQLPDELPTDSQWEDTYDAPPSSNMSSDDLTRALENHGDTGDSLHQQLRWQLDLTPLSEADHAVGLIIIDAINDEGFLGLDLEGIHTTLHGSDNDPASSTVRADAESELDLDDIANVLKLVQNFDPIGVAARDLPESLTIQLNALDIETPGRQLALRLVDNYFELLGRRDFRQIKRRARVNEEDLAIALELIRSLNPRPGAHLHASAAEYVTPDVYVYPKGDDWQVELNPRATPRLGINNQYAALIRRGDNSSDNTFLKNNLQEARWLLKSLQSRNDTLMRVATAIVERQRGFLERGEEGMTALILNDIADQLELHESTISRVTTNKYMHTPRGVFELKYFFSSHVSTSDGGEVSSTAIRAVIKRMVGEEQPRKPLSDNKIATMLSDQGFQVARRTVAKYRESMAIPSSSERKRLA